MASSKYTILFSLAALSIGTEVGQSPAWAVPFVEHPLTLPSSTWALDVGVGLAHQDRPAPLSDPTGFGFNLELRGGLTPSVQLGLRTGLRLGSEGRTTKADQFGRAFDTETYGTGFESIANPEVSLRFALIRGRSAALAFESRLYVPIESGTKVGIMLAAPLHLHLGESGRLDSGIYVPIIFTDPRTTVISLPFHFWLQVDPDLALGLLTGVRFYRPGGGKTIPLGAGINYAVSSVTDLRAWFLFPDVRDGGTSSYGAGLAIEARF